MKKSTKKDIKTIFKNIKIISIFAFIFVLVNYVFNVILFAEGDDISFINNTSSLYDNIYGILQIIVFFITFNCLLKICSNVEKSGTPFTKETAKYLDIVLIAYSVKTIIGLGGDLFSIFSLLFVVILCVVFKYSKEQFEKNSNKK